MMSTVQKNYVQNSLESLTKHLEPFTWKTSKTSMAFEEANRERKFFALLKYVDFWLGDV